MAVAASVLDPWDIAEELGIRVREIRGFSWCVASTDNTVIYRWDPLQSVRNARLWEGIAQCLLTRVGAAWTATDAQILGSRLRLGRRYLH